LKSTCMTDLHRLRDSRNMGPLTVRRKQLFENANIGKT